MRMHTQYPRQAFECLPDFADLDRGLRDAYLEILDHVYFASMLFEEGEAVPIGVVVDDDGRLEECVDSSEPLDALNVPELAWVVTRFSPIPLTPRDLKRVARGTVYGLDLVVVRKCGDTLAITGLARRRRRTDGGAALRIAAPRPGVLLLEGMNRCLVRYEAGCISSMVPDVLVEDGPVLAALRECGASVFIVSELLRHARQLGTGALFCLLPQLLPALESGVLYRLAWPQVLSEIDATRADAYLRMIATAPDGELVSTDDVDDNRQEMNHIDELDARLSVVIEQIAALAAIDGATIIGPDLSVVGSGYIIPTGEGNATPCVRARDILANEVEPPSTFGARHTAGVSFAYQYPGALAFIVSADGPITCAHRLGERVVMWPVQIQET